MGKAFSIHQGLAILAWLDRSSVRGLVHTVFPVASVFYRSPSCRHHVFRRGIPGYGAAAAQDVSASGFSRQDALFGFFVHLLRRAVEQGQAADSAHQRHLCADPLFGVGDGHAARRVDAVHSVDAGCGQGVQEWIVSAAAVLDAKHAPAVKFPGDLDVGRHAEPLVDFGRNDAGRGIGIPDEQTVDADIDESLALFD